jgi:hypothetical protein
MLQHSKAMFLFITEIRVRGNMKATLTHIGVVSLGRLFAIWTAVIGGMILLLICTFLIVMTLLGGAFASGSEAVLKTFGTGLAGVLILFIAGVIAVAVQSIIAFVIGAVCAVIYNIILGVGGIDIDLKERG